MQRQSRRRKGGKENGMKQKKKVPHSFVIVFCMIIAAVLLTWLIPAGEYIRSANENGVVMIQPDSYRRVEGKPASLLKIPFYIVSGFTENVSLVLVLLFSGGAFRLVEKTGALSALIQTIAYRLRSRRYLLLVMLTAAFAVVCSNQAIQIFIPFAPVLAMAAIALGFDSITGIAVLILGGGIGFSTGTLRTTTTLVAQNIAQLPPYSGLWFRAISMACFLAVTCPLLCLYARRVAADPQRSPMYVADRTRKWKLGGEPARLTGCQIAVLSVVGGFICLMVGGSIGLGWNISDIAGVFIWMAIAVGAVWRMPVNEICREFVQGAADMLPAAILTGMGTSISVVFKEAGIIDSIVNGLSCCVIRVPDVLRGAVLYLVNTVINVFITSGTAQAAVVMPIFVPLSDMMGITRQTCVLAYNFGDGFSNYVLPTSSALMGVLGAANVPYGSWMKFMGKIFCIWVVLSCVLTSAAQYIHLGPH